MPATHLEGAIEGVLVSEQLVMMSDTVQPAPIHQSLAYGYSLGPDRDIQRGWRERESRRQTRDKIH